MKQARKRDPEKTRSQVLEAAFSEIYRRGFNGVGVRELAAKAGVTIGAFFHYFPTKIHVAHAIIAEIIHPAILERWIKPLSAHKNPLQGVLKCFRSTFTEWPDEFIPLGCPLNNLTQELSGSDASIRSKAGAVLNDWIDKTEEHLDRARDGGYLRKTTDTRELAEFIVTFQEGTFAMGKALGDRRIFDSLYRQFKHHLESA